MRTQDNFFSVIVLIFTTFFALVGCDPIYEWDSSKINYPQAKRSNTTFSYNSLLSNGTIINVSIADPYHWLEEDVNKSNETKEFVKAEMELTQSYLDGIQDYDLISKSIYQLQQFTDIEMIQRFGQKGNEFYLYQLYPINSSREIWYIATSKEMEEAMKNKFDPLPGKKWFDENLLSKDGTGSINAFYPSPDGKLMAYAVVSGGTDVSTIYIRNTSTPLLDSFDFIPGGKGRLNESIPQYLGEGLEWSEDNNGFFYTQELRDKGNSAFDSRVQYHFIGKSYEEDILIIDKPKDPSASYSIFKSVDKEWLLVLLNVGTDNQNAVYITSLIDQQISNKMKWQSIASTTNSMMYWFGNVGSTFFFATDSDDSINGKIVSVEVDKSKAKVVQSLTDLNETLPTKVIIPELPDAQLETYDLIDAMIVPVFDKDKLLIYYTKNATHQVMIVDLTTGEKIEGQVLPKGHGTVSLINTDLISNELFLSTSTMNKPRTIYRISYEGSKIQTEIIYEDQVLGTNLDIIISERHYSTSKDRTMIPFDVFYNKETRFNGSKPTILFFYGQYGINNLPGYNSRLVEWIIGYDGLVIWAYPRGGGENGGAKWHFGGWRENRQNTVDDVISVAEYVVENQITGMGKIIVNGASAAGTTCMVVTNQAREGLLGGALCDRGVYDMLRFPEMQITGDANIVEYGDPHNPKDFSFLKKYSPLLNVNSSKSYPFILLFAPANDDRVSPTNDYKMIAELQNLLPKNKFPLLLYLQKGVGHDASFNGRNLTNLAFTVKTAIPAKALGLKRKNV